MGLKDSSLKAMMSLALTLKGTTTELEAILDSLCFRDVATIDGTQFKHAAVIVASPPCQKYSYMAMPWSRGKAMAAEIRQSYTKWSELNFLFAECFRIAWEAETPLILENVYGAQEWVGPAKWHCGPIYLWGDIPALFPNGQWAKNPGRDFNLSAKGVKSRQFNNIGVSKKESAALAAKIPFPLARHIARCFKPDMI